MSKSAVGKLVLGAVFVVLLAIMIANNLFRAFDAIPYGTGVVFFGFFFVWFLIYSLMSRYGYFDWWHKK